MWRQIRMAESIQSSNPYFAGIESLRECDFARTLDILADAALLSEVTTGRITHANGEALRTLGYSLAEIRKMTLMDISITSEDIEQPLPLRQLRHQNGSMLWMDARAKKITLDDGLRLFLDLRDVTDRKLREERLRIILEALDDCGSSVLILHRNKRATYLNAAFGILFGYTADRVNEINYDMLFSDKEQASDAFETAVAGGQWQGEIKMLAKSNREFPAFLRATPVLGDDYDVCAILFILNDATERNQMEAQLRQSQNMKAIGQLAAGIAHEINTPVQYVGDNVRFIQDCCSSLLELATKCENLVTEVRMGLMSEEKLREIEETIERIELPYLREEVPLALSQSIEGIGRVCEIVRAMRQFTHAGNNERKTIDLNQAIENTILVARNEWKYIADVETKLDPDLPQVPCFPGGVNQVLLNLIVNAAHAIADSTSSKEPEAGEESPKGKITISTFSDGDWVEIHVADTGAGIPEEIRERVFEMFFTTKDVGKGTGQGLAICHAVVVEKHGGTITFESEVGKGTDFRIRLPLRNSNSN
jgi:PAS domain S-box-containing protein